MTAPRTDSKGAAIGDKLSKFKLGDGTVFNPEELDAILAILAQEVKRVIGEDEQLHQIMTKELRKRGGEYAEMLHHFKENGFEL